VRRIFAGARYAAAIASFLFAMVVVAGCAAAEDVSALLSGLPLASLAGATQGAPATMSGEGMPSTTGERSSPTPGSTATARATPDLQPGLSLGEIDVIAKQLDIAAQKSSRASAPAFTISADRRSKRSRRATIRRSTGCCCRPRASPRIRSASFMSAATTAICSFA
jgi:hypothetical protein